MSPFVLAMAMAMEDSSNVIVKTPNTETPPQPQPIIGNSISFSTGGAGAEKRRHHAAAVEAPVVVLYKECLKNHAAGIGGLALDGCGEFMPSATASAADPASLKCAACGCHRNFHRLELDDPPAAHFIGFHNPHRLPPPLDLSLTPSPTASPCGSPPRAAATPLSSAPHTLLALGNEFSGQNRRDPVGKKRFRSKFSHTQKQKMRSFAEKLGWKLHKTHESLVEEFCSEIGVTRGVFKVWMHNNKHRDNQNHHQIGNNGINKSNGINGNGINHDDDDDEQNGNGSGNNSRGSFDTDNENQQNEGNSDHLLHVSTNGSSSSS